MKRMILFAALYLCAIQSHAMSAQSRDGFVACITKEWVEDMVSFARTKDTGSFQAYIDSKKCVIMKEGLKVTVTDSPGILGRTAGFVYQGIKLWTVRDGLDYGK